MRLLLDTQALLWWLEGHSRLGAHAHDTIANPGSTVWVSAVAAWEIVIKSATGRLRMGEPAEICLPREMETQGFQPLPVTIAHALGVRSLPNHHGDPFDRMLVAQARLEGLTLVTSDAIFDKYDVTTLDARR